MIQLPYGTGAIPFDPAGAAVLTARQDELLCDSTGAELVRRAMAAPIGSPPLCELARGKRTCTLIVSDHTRPVPSRDIVPAMLDALRAGNPSIDVTLLVATGCHRGTTRGELAAKLGEEMLEKERIVIHDCADAAAHVRIGVLPSGAPLVVNRLAAETDLLVAEGFIEPHFFAGFSGGRKSVLPGVCDRSTVLGNHCGQFIHSPLARAGVLDGNPIHEDMQAAARMAGLAFVVNVVINDRKETVAAFAGEPDAAHRAGCAFLLPHCSVRTAPAGIVVVTNGGAPLDQNVYQCVKGLATAEAAAKDGGVLILCAACEDGVGGEGFYRALRDCQSPAALYRAAAETPAERTVPDQWQSQILARVLMRHRVIFVTRPALRQTILSMKMEYAPTVTDALLLARETAGADASVAVIPNGVSVIVSATG